MIKAITIAARIPVAVCSDLNLRPQFGQFTAKTETEWPQSGQGFRFSIAHFTTRPTGLCARVSGSRCLIHRKRESLHDVIDCGAPPIRLRSQRQSARRTTVDIFTPFAEGIL
jgi:hypothetical protein